MMGQCRKLFDLINTGNTNPPALTLLTLLTMLNPIVVRLNNSRHQLGRAK